LEQGERKAKIEIAKSLLLAKVDLETIAISTGISIEEIKNIKKEN
jgi:hypothetical protein